jgi:hypothetical protein
LKNEDRDSATHFTIGERKAYSGNDLEEVSENAPESVGGKGFLQGSPDPDDSVKAIGQALAQVTTQDALGWSVSCGYSFC